MSRHMFSALVGKTIKHAAKLRGGGSALPGLVVEKIDPSFMARALSSLPYGVVIISGTNGKTTTTKITVELLEAAGLRVFTNRTGSNFSRGVVAALLGEVDMKGTLHADIAVLELDEAWAVKFVKLVKPRYSLLLNVMRDQLDRFGEIDTTAGFLQKIAEATTDAVILNKDDHRVANITTKDRVERIFFGTTKELLSIMPTDDALKNGRIEENTAVRADVRLEAIDKNNATYTLGEETVTTSMKLSGVYNLLNAAGALALVRQILPDANTQTLIQALEKIQPAFGRGEKMLVNGVETELVLVKNPSGFRLALLSFATKQRDVMIAINDNYADGRDMSWLWDVDFSSIEHIHVISGARAHDMALRLRYDEAGKNAIIEPDLKRALEIFLGRSSRPRVIFCSYTAMLTLRKALKQFTDVEDIR